MELRRIQHNTPEYEHVVALRRRVLRAPLGLDFTPEQLAAEADDIHLAGFEGETPVACLILAPVSAQEFKMRQVAVAPERQGERLGSRLVEYCETVARAAGCVQITLHARETAVLFYLRAGYEIVGEPFEEVTVPHRKMMKWLK
jgi:predicted GNAT family N-acyltransferase